MATTTNFDRGDTIVLIHAEDIDPANILSVSAVLKRATSTDPTAFPPGQPVVATMTFTAAPHMSTSTKLVWFVGLSAAQCAALELGLYATQVRTEWVNGTVDHGEIRFIRIIEPVEG